MRVRVAATILFTVLLAGMAASCALTFPPTSLPTSSLSVPGVVYGSVVIDTNRDGDADVLVALDSGGNPGVPAIRLFLGNSSLDLSSAAVQDFSLGLSSFSSPVVTDVDGDSWLDVLYAVRSSDGSTHGLYLLINLQTPATPYGVSPTPFVVSSGSVATNAVSFHLYDLDADGYRDYVWISGYGFPPVPANPFPALYMVPGTVSGLPGGQNETPRDLSGKINRMFQVTYGDFDGSGSVDVLYVTGKNTGVVVGWLQNNGSAAFVDLPLLSRDVYDARFDMATGGMDVDQDGIDDAVVRPQNDAVILIYFGQHGVGLTPEFLTISQVMGSSSLLLVDFTSDGGTDILYAGPDRQIFLVTAAGSRSWSEPQVLYDGHGTTSALTLGDLNGDATDELLFFPTDPSTSLQVVAGDRSVDLGDTTVLTTWRENLKEVVTADVNADGFLDVVFLSDTNAMFLPQSPSGFDASAIVELFPFPLLTSRDLVVGDVDGSGSLDVLVSGTLLGTTGSVFVLLNSGGGVFAPPSVALSSASAQYIQLADIDGNGVLDLVFANLFPRWAAGDGTGAFVNVTDWGVLQHTYSFATCDIDHDGDIDILTDITVRVSYNLDGQGVSWNVVSLPYPSSAQYVSCAHADGDGWEDIFAASRDRNAIFVTHNDGSGGFVNSWTSLFSISGDDPGEMAVYDMNGDGIADVVVSDRFFLLSRVDITILYSSVDLGYQAGSITQSVPELNGVAFGDWNGDGIPDIVLASTRQIHQVVTAGTAWAGPPSLEMDDPVAIPECGGVPSMACLSSWVSRTPLCGVTHLDLAQVASFPPGACPPSGIVWAKGKGVISNGVLSCSNGGALFSVEERSTLELVNVNITGTTFASITDGSPSGLRVVGSGSRLILTNSFVSMGKAVLQLGSDMFRGGYGGVMGVWDGGEAIVQGCTFTNSTASGGGGTIAVLGTGSYLSMTNSVIRHSTGGGGGAVYVGGGVSRVVLDSVLLDGCTASNGWGGAVLVAASSDGSRVEMKNTVITHSSAAMGGGSLAVLASGSSVVVEGASVVEHSEAKWGGAVAVMSPAFALGLDVTGGASTASLSYSSTFPDLVPTLPVLLEQGWPLVELGPGVVVSSASATFGGCLLICDGIVNASGDVAAQFPGPYLASTWGLFGMTCSLPGESPSAAAPHTLFAYNTPSVGWSSPPVALEPVGFPSKSFSSLPLGQGHVLARDAYGAVVRDPKLVMQASVGSNDVVLSGVGPDATVSVDGSGSAVFSNLALSLLDWASSISSLHAIDLALVDQPSVATPVALTVGLCPPGWGRTSSLDSQTPLTCSECLAGTSSDIESVDACAPVIDCGADAVLVNGSCLVCPALAAFERVNETCLCVFGTWTPSGVPNSPCSLCPLGAVCDGGLGKPRARPGFWQVSEDAFVSCRFQEACRGDNVCGARYSGYQCKDCGGSSSEIYRASDGSCQPCPSLGVGLFVLGVLIVIGLTIAVVLSTLYSVSSIATSSSVRSSRKTMPHTFSVLLTLAQIVALLGDAPVSWPSSVQRTMQANAWSNVDIALFAPSCSTSGGFMVQFVITILVPIVALAVAVVVVGVWRALVSTGCTSYGESVSGVSVLERTLFSVGPTLYIPFAKSALEFFDCTQLENGKWYLDAEPKIECFVGQWTSLLPLGVVAVLLYVFALPGVFAHALYTHRGNLAEPGVVARFGPIFSLYRTRYFYFGLVDLGKRLAIVVVALFVSDTPELLLSLLLGLFLVSTFGTAMMKPYFSPIYTSLDVRLGCCVSVLVVAASFFWADDFSSDGTRQAFTVLTFICLGASVGTIGWTGLSELRQRRSVADKEPSEEQVRMEVFWQEVERHVPDLEDRIVAESIVALRSGDVHSRGAIFPRTLSDFSHPFESSSTTSS